jgi:hypothetical protein
MEKCFRKLNIGILEDHKIFKECSTFDYKEIKKSLFLY